MTHTVRLCINIFIDYRLNRLLLLDKCSIIEDFSGFTMYQSSLKAGGVVEPSAHDNEALLLVETSCQLLDLLVQLQSLPNPVYRNEGENLVDCLVWDHQELEAAGSTWLTVQLSSLQLLPPVMYPQYQHQPYSHVYVPGSCFSPSMICFRRGCMLTRSSLTIRANITRAMIWLVYACGGAQSNSIILSHSALTHKEWKVERKCTTQTDRLVEVRPSIGTDCQ